MSIKQKLYGFKPPTAKFTPALCRRRCVGRKCMFDRAWERILAKAKQAGSCLLFGANPNIYGMVKVGRKTIGAHRVAFAVNNGPLIPGMYICHTCDTPACVEPSHLWQGTCRDNILDCIAKGRYNKSRRSCSNEEHPRTKISNMDVALIRALCLQGWKRKEVATHFGISPDHVKGIHRGLNRKNIAPYMG